MIGELLNDRYRIDKEIGQAGMGTVYRGFDTTLIAKTRPGLMFSGLWELRRYHLADDVQTVLDR